MKMSALYLQIHILKFDYFLSGLLPDLEVAKLKIHT